MSSNPHWEKYLSRLQKRSLRSPRKPVRRVPSVRVSTNIPTAPAQTYPDHIVRQGSAPTLHIVRQGSDLTCGMRCLQNLYGPNIVTRSEMDVKSQKLQLLSSFVMYDPQLGYYSMEVLQAILSDKGISTQRVDMDKFSQEYFEPAIAMNPDLVGYVVAIGGEMKHYVAILAKNGIYTLIDSRPGTSPISIEANSLFQHRDGHIYCSQHSSDTEPVVAIIAVGNSPFVEYNIMHDIWTLPPPPPSVLLTPIRRLMQTTNKRSIAEIQKAEACVQEWFQEFKKKRIAPPENCLPFLKRLIGVVSSINVKMNETQTIIQCCTLGGLLTELKNMGWILPGFHLRQNGQLLQDENGQDIDMDDCGTFEEYSLDPTQPVELIYPYHTPIQASVGGFFTFNCTVSGECIDDKGIAYSVRDKTGTVHILYKQSVERLEKMNHL